MPRWQLNAARSGRRTRCRRGPEAGHAGAPSAGAASPILEMRNIAKRFDATQALEDVSLALYSGEVHALLGENGAGKSTLIKIMTGVYQPDRGEILLAGKHDRDPRHRRGAAPRHRGDLPGADALPRPQRRGEHLHQPPGPRRGRQLAHDVPRGGGDPRRTRRRPRRAEPGARADARRPAVGRDRQGDLAQRPRPDHGRADRVALGPRGRASSSSSSATSATRASPSSSSATAWRRSSRSPTRSRCSATAG